MQPDDRTPPAADGSTPFDPPPWPPAEALGACGPARPDEVVTAAAGTGHGAGPDVAPRRPWWRDPDVLAGAALALVVGAIAAVLLGSRRPGHWWGDDWALYIRQAEGLLNLSPGEVARANQFTVTTSIGGAFSPALYPWGFPFLLALAIPFTGTDVDSLANVEVFAACAFAVAWWVLARPRLGRVAALVGVPAVALTPVVVSWAELIQSELPFMAAATIGLALLDLVARRGGLVGGDPRWWPLVVLGVWAAFAFEIRREGLALVPAIATAQLAWLVTTWSAPSDRRERSGRLVARLLVPHACTGAVTLLIKVALPSVIVPNYAGNSVANTWRRWDRNVDHVLEVAGLKRPQTPDPTVLGSTRWGWIVAGVWIGLVAVGIVLALSWRLRRDAFLVVYAAGAFVIGASAQGSLNRYFASVAPVLTLLAATALATLVWLPVRRFGRAAVVVPALVVALGFGGVTVANARDARVRLRNTERILDSGMIEWGAQHPAALEMYAEVRARTAPDDIVASPKARAMGLLTERPSIQVDDYRPIPPNVPIALLVVEPASRVAATLLDDPAWRAVWSNSRFVLYEPTGSGE